jgi:hypothetical protein
MAALWGMEQFGDYVRQGDAPESRIAFFFEQGHAGAETLADFIETKVRTCQKLRDLYRFESYTPVQKHHSHVLGAADILAWHQRTGTEALLNGKAADERNFFKALDIRMRIAYFGPKNINAQAIVQSARNHSICVHGSDEAAPV